MTSPSSPSAIASSLLSSKGLQLQSFKFIQSLWAGYGQIYHLTASLAVPQSFSAQPSGAGFMPNSSGSTPQELQSFILKIVTSPPAGNKDEGHLRKILSYQVEQRFYSALVPLLPPSIPVPKYLLSINKHHSDGTSTTAMILSDLREQYPVAGESRGELSSTQVYAALDWLSSFHGFWWPKVKDMDRHTFLHPPLEEMERDLRIPMQKSVWLNGGYTYLATRRKEYQNLASDYESEWNEPLVQWEEDGVSISEMIADVLAPRESGWSPTEQYQTIIHGDVKSENFFSTTSGQEVAFYDFQYTGLGLGVCDLAKLFTCSVPLHMLIGTAYSNFSSELDMQEGEKALLKRYWIRLKNVSKKDYDWDVFVMHWETALVDWLRFQASWGFWGNTKWLEARGRRILKSKRWREQIMGNWRYRQSFESV